MSLPDSRFIPAPHIVSFIDIGTNSIRLFVVRFNQDCSYTVLSKQKESVRLGEGEYETRFIKPAAMDRAITVVGKFVDLARSFGAEEFVAVATSATREAENRNEFLKRLRQEANLEVRVITGREEARLIYLGVTSGMHLENTRAIVIDIGGGSTEIAIGNKEGYSYLLSLKLGAIRLSNLHFPPNFDKPVPKETYEKLKKYIQGKIRPLLQHVHKHPFDICVGSSGTLINLLDITTRMFHPEQNELRTMAASDLQKSIQHLCSLSLQERRKISGINPERADIIIAGAAIIDTLLECLKITEITITPRGLQDGLLTDYLSRMEGYPFIGELSTRERSVLLTGRSYGINELHARTVSKIALDLFDSARLENLHGFEEVYRELLEHSAFLHDIGSHISFKNHHEHSYYIIRNSNLLGFDSREVNIIANIARFHRKKFPRTRSSKIPELSHEDRKAVRKLAAFLRLAESLDRSHTALIESVRFTRSSRDSIDLIIVARGDCQFEFWGLQSESKQFRRVFGKKIRAYVVSPENAMMDQGREPV